ncbi:NAD(P)/FAD-dependent oxidoreductase [Gordonia asplenii]|uniref:NAD(P)/FAD-dependent oxidoreductase n=1 Tax=Gordonia asplenii TaxID=2725283 RepID=UPI0028AFB29F|nr:NAD(P)/FAD-dependent oxidoreductase [Gordonia asplenii]
MSNSPDIEVVVVGAGVVGLAVARELATRGRSVAILEAADDVGTETSSRNSEVIHSGIYYPTGSLKARACVAGRDSLYRYCAERGIAHRRTGKLIVATSDDQHGALDVIAERARRNGVDDLRRLSAADVGAVEPALRATSGLLCPSTGIVDSHGLMRALLRDALDAGADVVLRSPVSAVTVDDPGAFTVATNADRITCSAVINCAGLGAWSVARATKGLPAQHIPEQHCAKGNYFGLAGGTAPFEHLVYPVPVDGGLGVHLTLDLTGSARFGPDVEWLDADAPLDYSVNPHRADGFYAAIRRYWPALPDAALVPAMAGIRPKCSGPGRPAADFTIVGPAIHGIAGLVGMFGIESPGLTSCLALAREVAALV